MKDLNTDASVRRTMLFFLVTFVFSWGWGARCRNSTIRRGYALPRLQALWSPLGASVVIGLVWGAGSPAGHRW